MLSSMSTFLFDTPVLVVAPAVLGADCRLLFVDGASVGGVGVGFIFNIEVFLPTATKTNLLVLI